jgi:SAM-dependent methyltransferase
MVEKNPQADESVNELYGALRSKHGEGNSKANGYLWHGYFVREQKLLFSILDSHASQERAQLDVTENKSAQSQFSRNGKVLLDVGCGSGLMCSPLVANRRIVAGLDFNEAACLDAKTNGIEVIRGDAFGLPIGSDTVDEIVTCQFFNQQSASAVSRFVEESARVLRPGGRVIMIWRNGEALVHRLALAAFRLLERIRDVPRFPYENHAIAGLVAEGRKYQLEAEYSAVSFPPCSWLSEDTGTLAAKIIGASNICVLRKPTNE